MKHLRIILFLIFFNSLQITSFGQIFVESEDYTSMNGVQTEGCSDTGGGLNVGWIDNNDWLEYDIEIPISGSFIISLRTASLSGGGVIRLTNEEGLLGSMGISATGSWQSWQTISSSPITLNEGPQKIKFTASTGGFNLNWFEIKIVDPVDIDKPSIPVITESYADVHSIELAWSPANDPTTFVTGYKIFNDDKFMSFTNQTSFNLSKLPPETSFNLSVKACDLAGNLSGSETFVVETTAIPWDLAWSDEFNGTEVDRDKWNFQVGGNGWGNGEAQYYTNGDNAKVENGKLIIEARKESHGSNQYTSSRMNNANKGDFLYGRIEVRAALPSTGGTWPAIWTLPTEWLYGNWPNCGEIDIMEHTGNNLNYVFGTIHTGAYNHLEGTAQSGGKLFDDVVNTFHTYTLEWYPDHLDWYYDDQIVFTYENTYETFAEWPFDIPHHVLLNVAIGGGLGGNIDNNGVWPQQMKVDFVRIYDFNLGDNDVVPPGNPTNLNAVVSGTNINLTWSPSIDNEYVEKYYIYLQDQLIDSISGSKYTVKYLEPLTQYSIDVQAKDFGGNVSGKTSLIATTGEIETIAIPGSFEAENYIYTFGMRTETCEDDGGGVNMAYIDTGDWLEYYIDVASKGDYHLWTRAASRGRKGQFELLNENGENLVTVETPVTGGWQNWETSVSSRFSLDQGKQKIKIKALGSEFNLNWFKIMPDSLDKITSVEAYQASPLAVYPNPFDGKEFVIDFENEVSLVDIGVFYVDGKVVSRKKYNNPGNRLIINDLNLSSGMFLVIIRFDNRLSKHLMVVK